MVSEKSKCNKQNEAGWDKEGLRDKKGGVLLNVVVKEGLWRR